MPKLQGFEFWSRTLGGARHVVAPMVDQSELAWRLLSRRHGAQLCYTPMLHAQVFVRDANYRKENLYCEVCPEDRPLIVQFCANDPEVFVQAALLAQDYCDAIDLNLGCPQMIAKRGHYGAFLQEEWDLLQRMILLAHEKLSVPVTCKIRVFPEIDKTVKYAQMLEKAGCQPQGRVGARPPVPDTFGAGVLPLPGRPAHERAGPVRSACCVDPWDMAAPGSNPPVATQGTGGQAPREPGPGFGLGSAATSRVEPCTTVFQLLTVHGRTKEQKGPLSGTASWEHIKAVRKAVAIPVFANGNIQSLRDVERCIQDTGVQGVMSAEGNLHNPALFEGRSPAVWELAEEYLDIVQHYRCPLSYVRAHLFKLWHHTLQVHQQLREELAKVKTLEGVAAVNQELKLRCQEDISRQEEGEKPSGGLPFFHWICQPYLRPGPREGSKENGGARSKRALEEEEGGTDVLSKNKQKKQLRNPHKTFDPSLKPKYAKCDQCGNPKGNRCVFNLCRGCCKKRAFREAADCPGHGLLFKTKLEKSLAWKGAQSRLQEPQPAGSGEPGSLPEVVGSALA
ncbi:tRNA-dihydrouridine(16/17) synthase [NAD(P)(+)]-like isoform X1 [Neomonachus schauinslandi]|uniref:tRNA-dihydrouridine(16/17) synthase [NAD(P)(+)] n=1 Tax=Neomonachus schauinslandi TaxID=29088 RepID=A0A2Y9GC36_NEOSC|nr:tRNA-dihydrouridine(16/17) synthase [NAD(P)(+)]-like isoform X1 [Neomonachus schauinslandi]XP_021536567.1 tRNA-dihydrouridine(16/17) synthase [NAD(P)(+)]-like isoform X1 [Neomonachus schauinslandi]